MNKLFYVVLLVVFVSCQSGNKTKTDEKAVQETAQLVESTLNIGGMHCEMCVASIEKGVKELDGVVSVSVSLNDSTAIVSFDKSKIDQIKVEQAIESRGYAIKKEMQDF